MNKEIYEKYLKHFPEQDPQVNMREIEPITASDSLIETVQKMISLVDRKKTRKHHAHLGGIIRIVDYKQLQKDATIPKDGKGLEHLLDTVDPLLDGQADPSSEFYLTNAIPFPTKVSIAANVVGSLTNSNAVAEIYGLTAYQAEVRVVAMMAEQIGFDKIKAGGYFTSGGTAGNKAALRIGLQKTGLLDPEILELLIDEENLSEAEEEKERIDYRERGVPNNIYVISNELSHFSINEAAASGGLGRINNIPIRSDKDNSMNIDDLEAKMRDILTPVEKGGKGGEIAVIYATVGTTDGFGMDEVSKVKEVRDRLAKEFNKPYLPHLHADMANGGFFIMFNDYDFENNPLEINPKALDSIKTIRERMLQAEEADSAIFDFHKLGYTPYLNSLFVLKDAADTTLVDRDDVNSPYINDKQGHHTGFTEECSRGFPSLPALANLTTLQQEGYQVLLGNLIERAEQLKELLEPMEGVDVLNKNLPGPIVAFRFYDNGVTAEDELQGRATKEELDFRNTYMTEVVREEFSQNRQLVFFGDTTKYRTVNVSDGDQRVSLAAMKAYFISPFTDEASVVEIAEHISGIRDKVYNLSLTEDIQIKI